MITDTGKHLDAKSTTHTANQLQKRCRTKKYDNIHDRFIRDKFFRKTMIELGRSEEIILEMDRLASEDHIHTVEGLSPAPHTHEQMTTSNYGYDIAYNFTHNNIMLEPNAMNNMNTVAHMDGTTRSTEHTARRSLMHNSVTSHLWLKSALHASSHLCMCTCVLRLGCFLFACPVLYFVPLLFFQPFLMFTSEFNERFRSNPLCDFRLGTVATSDHETPLTGYEPKKDLNLVNTEELDFAATSDVYWQHALDDDASLNDPNVDDYQLAKIPCSCSR